MRRVICGIGGLVLLVVLCGRGAALAPAPVPDELPPGWTAAEIARGTPPLYAFDLTGVSVLAWEIHDDGAFCYESCLVLRVLPKDYGHGRWCLAHLYRHPRLPNPR